MKGINLYHEVPCGTPEAFHVIIDLPKEARIRSSTMKKEAILSSIVSCISQPSIRLTTDLFHRRTREMTRWMCVLLTHPTFSGCVVKARAIGLIRTSDQDGPDDKVIAVPVSKVDPRFDEIQSIEDLPVHVREEFLLYFKEYKKLEKAKYDKIVIEGSGVWKKQRLRSRKRWTRI